MREGRVLIISLLLGIATPPAYFPSTLERVSYRCRFAGTLRPEAILLPYERQWYGGVLAAAGERPLYPVVNFGPAVTVRFLWLRSFHAPIVVRVTPSGAGGALLVATELSGLGGLPPGRIRRQSRRVLSAAQAGIFQAMIRQTSIVTVPPKICIDALQLDGAEWVIETAGPAGYSYAARWSPDDGAVYQVGRYMLKLMGWRVGPVY